MEIRIQKTTIITQNKKQNKQKSRTLLPPRNAPRLFLFPLFFFFFFPASSYSSSKEKARLFFPTSCVQLAPTFSTTKRVGDLKKKIACPFFFSFTPMARFVNVQKTVAVMFPYAFCEHFIIIQGERERERQWMCKEK
jgi:hypothetical protein